MKQNQFNTATQAFEYLYDLIMQEGKSNESTKYLTNVGFEILHPMENNISTEWRNFNLEYANYEWQWYLSGDPNADEISKRAKIWKNCQDEFGNVNSNYGYQWKRNNQIDYVIGELRRDKNSRRAVLSIYDAKEWQLYKKDTPCTLAIYYSIEEGKLNASVMMRSNDLVFGFCNDQFCFSNLQKLIADELNIPVGTYYHFVNNLHIYSRHFNMKQKNK